MTKELTGRHVLIIALIAFGTIITANMAMLFAATGSFPGLVVKNAYVASQGWNERAQAQANLGWSAFVTYADHQISVEMRDERGEPVRDLVLTVELGRPSSNAWDQVLTPKQSATGYDAPIVLVPGVWRIQVLSKAPTFAQSTTVFVSGAKDAL